DHRALIEFALLDPFGIGYHPGANRNALLLHNVGRPFFCADDDTICRPASFGNDPRAIGLSDAFDPTSIWPYEDFTNLERSMRFAPVDILGEHERILG